MRLLIKLIIAGFSFIILGCVWGLILIIQYPEMLNRDSILPTIIDTVSTFSTGYYILFLLSIGFILTGSAMPVFYILISVIKHASAGNKTPKQSQIINNR